MALKNKSSDLIIPKNELIDISYDVRVKLIHHMVAEYKKRLSGYSVDYVYLNRDKRVPCDYMIIFREETEMGYGNGCMYDISLLFTPRTLPGYRYCLRENLLDDFFNDAFKYMTKLPYRNLLGYLQNSTDLSISKNDSNYWKGSSSGLELSEALITLALYDTKPK